jgi:hypothetical protein
LAGFDLVLDTSAVTVAEAAAQIARTHAAPEPWARRVLVCPRYVIPAFGHVDDDVPWVSESAPVAVVHARPFFFAVAGERALVEAVRSGDAAIPVHVIAEGDTPLPWGGTPSSLVEQAKGSEEVKRWETTLGLHFAGLRRFPTPPPG